jgi:alpha-galactosidase
VKLASSDTRPSNDHCHINACRNHPARHTAAALLLGAALLLAFSASARAQTPGIAAKPYMGWSSYSQQTISSTFLTQANIAAQSDALISSGLQAHGYDYINIDFG